MKASEKFRVENHIPLSVEPFDLTEVRLLDGPFKRAMEADAAWLLSLEPDRLLSRFREYAGLKPKGQIYGGWESGGLSGHSLGHFLTACSLMYQAAGNERFAETVRYVVDELDECQRAHGNGFLSGLQDCKRIFAEVAAGDIRTGGFDLNGGWAPWYTQHKLFAGLRDSYLACGNEKALHIMVRLADWVQGVTGKLTDEKFTTMLKCEYGGMTEVLADAYALTGDERYLALAKRFYDPVVLDPLTRKEDNLTGLHGNTQIPKLIGLERLYELTGEERFHTAADFFWRTVVRERSYVIGGNTEGEYFHDKNRLSDRLSDRTCETCNTYNMLKLTKRLFMLKPDAEMADYCERAIYNHILASQNPENGMTTYMMPLRAGCAKGFSDPFNSFWCCTGTAMENHANYGEYIGFHDRGSLYVNLFIASTLNWKARGVKITQKTRFPEEPATTLVFDCARPVELSVNIRHPWWARDGFAIRVNGAAVPTGSRPASYATVAREWRSGDTLDVAMPMALRTEAFADNPHRLAVMQGPIVLCAETEADAEPRIIVSELDRITDGIKPVEGRPLAFTGSGAMFQTAGGRHSEPRFIPLYAENKKGFTVYWDAFNEAEWETIRERYLADLSKARALEKRTTDFLQLGEMQPERDHQLESARSSAGDFVNRKFRRADERGWFRFTMKVDPSRPVEFMATYAGTEACRFEIRVEDQLLATQKLADNNPGVFVDIVYPVPAELTRGREKITVKFVPAQGSLVGRVFGCRMLLSDGPR